MGVDQGLEGGKSMDWVWVDPWVTHAQPYYQYLSVSLSVLSLSGITTSLHVSISCECTYIAFD